MADSELSGSTKIELVAPLTSPEPGLAPLLPDLHTVFLNNDETVTDSG
jgi:hypothetical protein